jgi:hypothetical protein
MTDETNALTSEPTDVSNAHATDTAPLDTNDTPPPTATEPAATDAPDAVSEAADAAVKKTPWYMKEIGALRQKTQQHKAEVENLRQRLTELEQPKQVMQDAPVNATQLIDKLAEEKARAMASAYAASESHARAADSIYQAGVSESGDEFKVAVGNLNALGVLYDDNNNPTPLMQTVPELPEPHKLLNYLGQNPDEAARISTLDPVRQAVQLTKLAEKLAKPVEHVERPLSKVPAPINPLSVGKGKTGGSADLSDKSTPMEAWIAARAQKAWWSKSR